MAEEKELPDVGVNPSELVLAGKYITVEDFSAWLNQGKGSTLLKLKAEKPDAIIKIGRKYIVNLEKLG